MSRWSGSSQNRRSYLWEMLAHKYNVYGLLSSVAIGTFLSIPLGLGPALIPILGYSAITSIAALFVPGSRSFQENVDRQKRSHAREATRGHLLAELRKRLGDNHTFFGVYHRLIERRDSLRKMAQDHQAISIEDIERLDDATVDFLGLWLGRTAIAERHRAFDEGQLKGRIADLTAQIESLPEDDNRKRLLKAKSDLETLVRRRQEMRTRDAAAEAAMLSMSDTFDEVYQRIVSSPSPADSAAAADLRSAVDRLNIEEELDTVLYDEVEAMLSSSSRGGSQ